MLLIQILLRNKLFCLVTKQTQKVIIIKTTKNYVSFIELSRGQQTFRENTNSSLDEPLYDVTD